LDYLDEGLSALDLGLWQVIQEKLNIESKGRDTTRKLMANRLLQALKWLDEQVVDYVPHSLKHSVECILDSVVFLKERLID
jgi:hypothetical protein